MRRLVAIACLLAAAVPLAGCGNKEEIIKSSETEAAYLDVGPLRYQVQISRQLNPRDTEDRAYLTGVAPAQARLKPDESWFGLFVRVENPTDKPAPATRDFELDDTQDTTYRPVAIARTNPFAYVGGTVAARSALPPAQSAAQQN